MAYEKLVTDVGFLGNGLNERRLNHQFCDVVLVSGERRFNAHHLVLANSPYFHASVNTSAFSEKQPMEIDMTNSIEGAVLESLIEFLYLGTIVIKESNAQSLLSAADLLMLPKVKEECVQCLQSVLSPINCLGIWSLASQHSCGDLHSAAFDFALKNFDQMSKGEEWLTVTVEQLTELLSGDQLTTRSADVVCSAALRWIHHRQEERKAHLLDILRNIRLKQCSGQFLVEALKGDSLVQESEECRRMVDEAISQLLAFLSSQQPTLKPADGQRKLIIHDDNIEQPPSPVAPLPVVVQQLSKAAKRPVFNRFYNTSADNSLVNAMRAPVAAQQQPVEAPQPEVVPQLPAKNNNDEKQEFAKELMRGATNYMWKTAPEVDNSIRKNIMHMAEHMTELIAKQMAFAKEAFKTGQDYYKSVEVPQPVAAHATPIAAARRINDNELGQWLMEGSLNSVDRCLDDAIQSVRVQVLELEFARQAIHATAEMVTPGCLSVRPLRRRSF